MRRWCPGGGGGELPVPDRHGPGPSAQTRLVNIYRHLGHYAAHTPHKPALVRAGSGNGISYAELDARSNRLARLLHAQGLRRGDQVAALLGNDLLVVEVAWAALRSGLCLRTVFSGHADCDARVLVAAFAAREQAAVLADRLPYCELRLMAGGCVAGWDAYEESVSAQRAEPLSEQWLGALDTGAWTSRPLEEGPDAPRAAALARWGLDEQAVALAAAPLAHSGSLAQLVALQFCGATAVVLEDGSAAAAQAAIARYGITHVLAATDPAPSMATTSQESP